MTERDSDQRWFDALSGQPQDLASESEKRAGVLRKAIQSHNEQLLGERFDENEAFIRLKTRLASEGLLNRSTMRGRGRRWGATITAMASAFAIGALTMRFTMMPAYEAVRSGGPGVQQTDQRYLQSVAVLVASPMQVANDAVNEAVRLQVDFELKSAKDGYDLRLNGLVPNSQEQGRLKDLLGISNLAGGDLVFQIRLKPDPGHLPGRK